MGTCYPDNGKKRFGLARNPTTGLWTVLDTCFCVDRIVSAHRFRFLARLEARHWNRWEADCLADPAF